ncbi:MAG: hypothetical protein ACRDYX_16690 [Egibacteraceae bacterium]
MSLRKLRHIGEAERPPAAPLDGDNLRAAFALCELCRRLRPWTPPRGIHRNTSLAEAQARRQTWEAPAAPP